MRGKRGDYSPDADQSNADWLKTPDPATPAGEHYLDAAAWGVQFAKCWIHNHDAPECEACRGELTADELAEGVAFARRTFRRWVDAGRPISLDSVMPAAFSKSERYGVALTVVAVDETLTRPIPWTH